MPSFKLDRATLEERDALLKRADEVREDFMARVAEAVCLSDHAWGKWLEAQGVIEDYYGDLDDFRLRVADEIELGVKTDRGREKWQAWTDDLTSRTGEIPDMHCEFEEADAASIFDDMVDDFRNLPMNTTEKPRG